MTPPRFRSARPAVIVCVALLAVGGSALRPQFARPAEPETTATPPGSDAPSTPHHALLQRLAGVWRARIEVTEGSSGETVRARGTETNRLCCGGRFLLIDLTDRSRKTPRGGSGVLGYDPARGRYLLAWAGALATSLLQAEGSYQQASDTLTFRYEQPDGRGRMRAMREVFAWDGPDRRSRTVYAADVDGSESIVVSITYRRR